MTKRDIYTVGGTVQAGNGLYLPRKADEELLELCRAGKFAYVLTPRQLGKSSLVVSTAKRLTGEQVRSVIIDLSGMGVELKPEAWYLGLLVRIEEGLGLETNVIRWWQAHSHLGVTQRLTDFFDKIVLSEISERVVIFVDEIDTTLSLDFTDDFYAAIRYLYNARSTVPAFKRLSFVLIGVAAPGDLIRDAQRTPFNIGQRVDLTDFTLEEALPLAAGLGLPDEDARTALAWILKWTNGHPYLTQRVCQVLADQHRLSRTEQDVDRIVADTFFGAISERDNNLQFVRDMLTKRAPDLDGVLATYREIRIGKKPVLDEEQSLIKNHLKLSGVICREKFPSNFSEQIPEKASDRAVLHVRNPIYSEVFDGPWVKEHMPINWFTRARQSGLLIVAAVLAISVIVLMVSNRLAEKNRASAQEETRNAKIELARAQEESRLVNDVLNSVLHGDAKSREYLDYQDNADGLIIKNSDAYKAKSALDQSLTADLRKPDRTAIIYDTPEKGALTVTLFPHNAVRVTRTGPAPNRVELSTWVPEPPDRAEPAPGPLKGAKASLPRDQIPSRGDAEPQFRSASYTAPGPLPGTAAGNCLNPHPGAFRSWYGEKNGCWVAVYRQWPDGCTHYQWYNACNGIWDTYPNGAPKVYWTNCVH